MSRRFKCPVSGCTATHSSSRGLGQHIRWTHPTVSQSDPSSSLLLEQSFSTALAVEYDAAETQNHSESPSHVEDRTMSYDNTEKYCSEDANASEYLASLYYLEIQEKYCAYIYGQRASANCETWDKFAEHIFKNPRYNNKKLHSSLKVYKQLEINSQLSRRDAENTLKLFHELIDDAGLDTISTGKLHENIQISWKQVIKDATGLKNFISPPITQNVPYPDSFMMDQFDTTNCAAPEEVTLLILDPIELIGQHFLNPEFTYEDLFNEIKLEYTPHYSYQNDGII
jgi:hypothetical protein